MKRFITIFMIVLFSSLGWWLGSSSGYMTSSVISLIGAVVGVIVAWKLNQIIGT